jgi:Ca2+-binding EF-hand superfamily protein
MAKGAGSKKAKKSGSNVFAMFSQRQIQEFKEAFGIMDCNKDGILNADDLVGAFSAVGKSISGGEADAMLSEAPGPVNFTQMVMLFAEKMAGGTDDDDTILKSFEAFEIDGKIDAEMFKHSLCTWGDKFTATEVDEAFSEFQIDGGMIDAAHLKGLMVSKKEGEEEGE